MIFKLEVATSAGIAEYNIDIDDDDIDPDKGLDDDEIIFNATEFIEERILDYIEINVTHKS